MHLPSPNPNHRYCISTNPQVTPRNVTVGAGGAVIALSEVDDEYDEMLLKATSVLGALGHKKHPERRGPPGSEPTRSTLPLELNKMSLEDKQGGAIIDDRNSAVKALSGGRRLAKRDGDGRWSSGARSSPERGDVTGQQQRRQAMQKQAGGGQVEGEGALGSTR